MPGGGSGYLVVRRDDGFGDVFPLTPGPSHPTLGRAATNRVVLKDELCSREHAEVYHANGVWRVRDLNSLNGTRLNAERLTSEQDLAPGDEVGLGKTLFLFVEDMSQLPDIPTEPIDRGGESIRKRLGQTRFLTPIPIDNEAPSATLEESSSRHNLGRDLSLLYRLALDMGSATSQEELVNVVLEGLLGAIPADVGAILSVKEGPGTLEGVGASPSQSGAVKTYSRVSDYPFPRGSGEPEGRAGCTGTTPIATCGIVVSLSDLGVTSVICAPVAAGERVVGLIHLYCTDPHKALDGEDLG